MSLVGSTLINKHGALVLMVSPLGCSWTDGRWAVVRTRRSAVPAGCLPCLACQRLLEEKLRSKICSL